MKSMSSAPSLPNVNNLPFGDAIILFDFDNQPKLGTQSIKAGGTFVFSTEFSQPEHLIIDGDSPFTTPDVFTNTPLEIVTNFHPKQNPFKFNVTYQGITQEVFLRIIQDGVDAGELAWDFDGLGPGWRVVLRMPGPEQEVRLIKELTPSSPFYNYQFHVYNQETRQPVPVNHTPSGEEVFVSTGKFITVALPPGARYNFSRGADEVGGTDAADLIISPGG